MSNRFDSFPQENLMKMESKLLSAAVAKENALHVSFHNETKAHQKQDDIIRNDYINKLHELDLANEKQHEQDNLIKKTNYGEYLLMQMDEKEKQKHKVTHSPVNTTAFCEAFVDPIEKNRLKLRKQKEFKDDLDECVRQKKDLKEKIHLKELAEDEKRNEFLKKQENDLLEFSEKNKQRLERKEQHKNDVAMMWKTENNHKMAELNKLADSAMNCENFENEDESNIELAEMQRRLNVRKALLDQMEERIEASYRKFEEEKREREKLLLEVQREEERLKKLKEEEKQKQMEYNKSLQAMIEENAKKNKQEKEAMIEEDKKLMEMQKSADEKINQVQIDLLERTYDDLKEYLPPVVIKEKEKLSLHSRFY